jgi:thioredoxin 1
VTHLKTLDQFDYHHVLAEIQGAALVFFFGPDCGACKVWRALLERYAENHPELPIFEVDAQRDLALTRELDVFHLPGLLLYRDGEYHAALQCEASLERLERAIADRLAQPAEETP